MFCKIHSLIENPCFPSNRKMCRKNCLTKFWISSCDWQNILYNQPLISMIFNTEYIINITSIAKLTVIKIRLFRILLYIPLTEINRQKEIQGDFKLWWTQLFDNFLTKYLEHFMNSLDSRRLSNIVVRMNRVEML